MTVNLADFAKERGFNAKETAALFDVWDDPTFRVQIVEAATESNDYANFKAKYRNDYANFVEGCIGGVALTPYQHEILAAVGEHGRVCVRGLHGIGKTAMFSWIILCFALTRDGEDWKVITTAGSWSQLKNYLWPEIHKWARRIKWERVGRPPFGKEELLNTELKLKTGKAVSVSPSNTDLMEGAHADHIMYVYDESKAIADKAFDASEGAFSTGEAHAIAMSTPAGTNGRFYDIHRKKAGLEDWWTRHVKLEEAMSAGRVTKSWAEQKKKLWKENSPLYQNRVLGEFASGSDNGLIPLAWVEAANERWHEVTNWAKCIAIGVDVGYAHVLADVDSGGNDETTQAFRYPQGIKEIETTEQETTMQTAGRVKANLKRHGGVAVVDVVGIGAGVYDSLKEQEMKVLPFSAGKKTIATDISGEVGFVNLRSAAWYHLSTLLDPESGNNIALPPNDKLTSDLTVITWRYLSNGRIAVESKEELKKRLGRSTDAGDAVVEAFALDIVLNDLRAEQSKKGKQTRVTRVTPYRPKGINLR